MPIFSREAMERPYRTLEATRVLRANAEVIELAAAGARADEVVVAVVREDSSFGGAWTFALEDLVRQVLLLEEQGGCSLTFSPNTLVAHVEQRCDELARIAQRWGEAMQRWARQHPGGIQE